MTFAEMAEKRYSVKNFSDQAVEDEKLQRVLETALKAPTAKNAQSNRIYVLKSKEAMDKIRSLTPCTYGAPVCLVFTYNTKEAFVYPKQTVQNSGNEDCSIVATHVMFAALEEGLGTCWVNLFTPSEVKEAFNLPADEEVVLLMPVGYAAEGNKPLAKHFEKKPFADVVKVL